MRTILYVVKSRLAGYWIVAWLFLSLQLAGVDAWFSVAVAVAHKLQPETLTVFGFDGAGVRFNLYTLILAITLSIAVGMLRPSWWRRGIVVLAAAPAPLLLLTSHHMQAGATVLALLFPTIWLGRELASLLLPEADSLDAWTVGTAFGLGLIATLGFVLGMVGLLRPQVIWPVLAIVTMGLLALARRRLRGDLVLLGFWLKQPVTRQPMSWLCAGVAVTFLWLNLIGALAPENMFDAVLQRTPTALHFARTGWLATDDPDLIVASDPVAGEVIYAMALALGPVQGAKIIHFLAGLFAAAAIFALGRRLGGCQAGSVATLAFYTMPFVAWLSQTAYLDLLTTLFAITAALSIVLPGRPGWRSAVAAGGCIGLGVGVKLHFGYVAVGLAVALGLLALHRGSVVVTVRLVLLLVITAALTAAPWLVRSYLLTGQVPGITLAIQSLTRAPDEQPAVMFDLARVGYGRSLGHLVRAPLDVVLRSQQFGAFNTLKGVGGHIGYLVFGLLPLLIVARPQRRVSAILAAAVMAFVFWFYTAQYLRYGMPIIALCCAVAGTAYATAQSKANLALLRRGMAVALLILLTAGISIQMVIPAIGRQVVFGRESEADYLTKNLYGGGSYAMLRLLDAEPTATRAFSVPEPARLYTRVRGNSALLGGASLTIEGTDDAILARLDEGGYTHIILDRRYVLQPNFYYHWDGVTVLNEEFLRRNAILVGGRDNAYLYRILPPNQRGEIAPWARGDELLPNGGFDMANEGLPLGWTPIGHPSYDMSGTRSQHGVGAVLITPQDTFVTSVQVLPGVRYLLSHATRSVTGYGQARLQIDWHDDTGRIIGTSREVVPVSPRAYHAFSLLATASPGAATATVSVQAEEGNLWVDEVSLRSVQPTEPVEHMRTVSR